MLGVFRAIKKPTFLDTELHKELRIKLPEDYSFCWDVDVVPVGFSEILSVSMYYPVFFGVSEGEVFPFAVMGINRRNVYLDSDGRFKVDVIPNAIKLYPFSVVRTKEGEVKQWTVVFDRVWEDKEGERLFDEEGNETAFFSDIKSKLEELAFDFEKALNFSKEMLEIGCLKLLSSLEVEAKGEKAVFKNVLIGNIDTLSKLSPEKLYYLNNVGYLPILYSVYFSIRNFKLFDLL